MGRQWFALYWSTPPHQMTSGGLLDADRLVQIGGDLAVLVRHLHHLQRHVEQLAALLVHAQLRVIGLGFLFRVDAREPGERVVDARGHVGVEGRTPRSGFDEIVAAVLVVFAKDAPLVDPPSGGVAFLSHDPLDRLPDDVFIAPEVRIRPDAALLEYHLPVFEVRALGCRLDRGQGRGLGEAGRDS